MIKVLFEKIKQKDNLQNLVTDFSFANRDCKATRMSLLNYLMMHCDQELRALKFIICGKYMPVPLLSWNIWNPVWKNEDSIMYDDEEENENQKDSQIENNENLANLEYFGEEIENPEEVKDQ